MAGDWIKVANVTPDKPEIDEMAAILKMSPEEVLGRLIRVWIWADQQSMDGNAVRVTSVTLSKRSGVDNFAVAMRLVGWLKGEDMALTFPNFERHNGETAKKRALTSKRVKRFRNEKVTAEALPEKRREEKSNTPRRLNGSEHPFAMPDWVPKEAWEGYCEMRTKIRKGLTDRAKTLLVGKLDDLRAKGHDARLLLEEATLKNWLSVYEPKAGAPAGGMAGMEGVV